MQALHVFDGLRESAAFRQCRGADIDQAPDVLFAKGGRIHGGIVNRGLDAKIVVGDPGGPGRLLRGVVQHARRRHRPDLVHQLRVDLEPVRVVVPVAGDRRAVTGMHQGQCIPIGHPDLVAHMVLPRVSQLFIGRLDAVFLHLQQVHVFDIGVVVRKRAVHLPYPRKGGAETVREIVWSRLVDEPEFVAQAVDVADDLPKPGSVDLVGIVFGAQADRALMD